MPFKEGSIPKTREEAVDHMLAVLGHKEKELIRNADESNLIQFGFGLGKGMRQTFHLWLGNKDLLRACGSETMHPKDATMVIIEALWRRLQTRD